MPRGVSPLDEARLQGRLWSPNVFRLGAWYDAADLSTITTVSGGVSDWRDKSGNGRNLTAIGTGPRPIYTENGFNNRPALNYGTGGTTLNSGMVWTGTAFNPVRTFGVAHWEGPNPFTAYSALLSYPYAGNSDLVLVEAPNGWFGARPIFLNGNDPIATPLPTISTPFLWVDNEAANAGKTTLWIGSDRGGGGRAWRGKIAEVVITLFAPTLRERRTIEGYLAWRWGLEANLPANHPYRNRPPLIGD
jgi:hypothetical protein